MRDKVVDTPGRAERSVQDVENCALGLVMRAPRRTDLLCTLRGGLAVCSVRAYLLVSACAGGGGGSSHSPSSPSGSSPTAPGHSVPDAPPPPPPSPLSSAPTAALSISLDRSVESDLAHAEETSLIFGGAVGKGPELERVIAVDSAGRPYWIELGDRTKATGPTLDLLTWLSTRDRQASLTARPTPGLAFGLDSFPRPLRQPSIISLRAGTPRPVWQDSLLATRGGTTCSTC